MLGEPSDFKDVALIPEKQYAKAVPKTLICDPDTAGPADAEPVYRKTTLVEPSRFSISVNECVRMRAHDFRLLREKVSLIVDNPFVRIVVERP